MLQPINPINPKRDVCPFHNEGGESISETRGGESTRIAGVAGKGRERPRRTTIRILVSSGSKAILSPSCDFAWGATSREARLESV